MGVKVASLTEERMKVGMVCITFILIFHSILPCSSCICSILHIHDFGFIQIFKIG